MSNLSRRDFVGDLLGGGALLLGAGLARSGAARADARPAAGHALTVVEGKPRERGRKYGETFRTEVRSFLEKEILAAFEKKPSTKDALLRYAGGCLEEIRRFSPIILDEMEGMAEGSGLRIEELVLITLHEELWHKGVLPPAPHCTAIAAGPPATADGSTYVGQTWDWMQSVAGLARVLLWKRAEGPSVLAYAYPGLWVGAGLNSAGIALAWTSGSGMGIAGPRAGIPSYVLIAQILYQDSIEAALAEARRARHAGWFTFVLGDGQGRLANVEGTPRDLAVETSRGHLARVYYGTRKITGTPEGEPVKLHPRCRRVTRLLDEKAGKLDRAALKGLLADHGDERDNGSAVCVHGSTLDAMLFDTTRREARLTRGPACSAPWQTFRFDPA